MNTTLEQTKQQSITIRVVFDGAPYAGKTTAAYSLSEALGASAMTPAEEDGRTLWFDWLTYAGGHHEGRAIRVELVTVPGQEQLAERRRHLLEWGDVVVFIADTSEAAFPASVEKFDELLHDLASHADRPIVVIANKRDLDDALPLEVVRQRLGLSDDNLLVEGIATSGGGIREAFIFAVQAALASSTTRLEETTADELLEEMQAAFPTVSSSSETAAVDTAALLDDAADASVTEVASISSLADEFDDLPAPPVASALVDEFDDLPAAPVPSALVDEFDDLPAPPAPPMPVVNEFDGQPAPESVEDSEPEHAEIRSSLLSGARLNPNGISDDSAIVILAEHWRMLVDVANGRSDLALTNGTKDAEVALELVTWGLISIDGWTPTDERDEFDSDENDLDNTVADQNDRYRELRELRRTLRR